MSFNFIQKSSLNLGYKDTHLLMIKRHIVPLNYFFLPKEYFVSPYIIYLDKAKKVVFFMFIKD